MFEEIPVRIGHQVRQRGGRAANLMCRLAKLDRQDSVTPVKRDPGARNGVLLHRLQLAGDD